MFVDIFFGIINISERLLPFVEGNGSLTRCLMSNIYNAKKSVIALARIAKVDIPWTLKTLTGNPDTIPLDQMAASEQLRRARTRTIDYSTRGRLGGGQLPYMDS